eukprot:GEMP01031260.1.p1 GENE.GEMP01031260.1~~GEMP01031260.1.p1  ORF type:complete len:449 (+),score=93.73 GEMP01031260.1:147-1493(+)
MDRTDGTPEIVRTTSCSSSVVPSGFHPDDGDVEAESDAVSPDVVHQQTQRIICNSLEAESGDSTQDRRVSDSPSADHQLIDIVISKALEAHSSESPADTRIPPELLPEISEEIINFVIRQAISFEDSRSSVEPSTVSVRECTPGVSSTKSSQVAGINTLDLTANPEASLEMLNRFLEGVSAACMANKESFSSRPQSRLAPTMVNLIQEQVRKVLDDELPTRLNSMPSSPQHGKLSTVMETRPIEEQILELLRMRDTEIRSLQKTTTAQDVMIEGKNAEIKSLTDKTSSLEENIKDLSAQLGDMRHQEEKSAIYAAILNARVDEMRGKADEEHELRKNARELSLREMDRMREEHKIEISAYRRALASEESRINHLQKEVRILETSRSLLSGDMQYPEKRKKRHKPKPKTLPQLENIYAPLSVKASTSLPRLESAPRFELMNAPFNNSYR